MLIYLFCFDNSIFLISQIFQILAVLHAKAANEFAEPISASVLITRGQHSSFRRNVATVVSRWHHCIRFDRLEIRTSDFLLQRQMRLRTTNQVYYN